MAWKMYTNREESLVGRVIIRKSVLKTNHGSQNEGPTPM